MIRFLPFTLLLLLAYPLPAQEAASLPNSLFLTWPEKDLSKRVVEGMERFVDQQIEDAIRNRSLKWQRDSLIPDQLHEKFVAQRRQQLREVLGVVDKRPPAKLEFFSKDSTIDGSIPTAKVAENDLFEVFQVRWSVLNGFTTEGLYVRPKRQPDAPAPDPISDKRFAMVLIPDVDETPEDLMGITAKLLPEQQLGVRWASAGFSLLIPTTIDRANDKNNLSYREWLHRKAYPMGRQVIGYEIQAALSAAEWLKFQGHKVSIGGYGEGGRIAFYAAACKPGFDSVFISGYFNKEIKPWLEPIDRTIWAETRDYGHAEIATLVFPTTLVVEQAKATESEIKRAGELRGDSGLPRWILNSEEKFGARAGYPAVAALTNQIGFTDANITRLPPVTFLSDNRTHFDAKKRHQRIVDQLSTVIENLHPLAEQARNKRFHIDAESDNKAIKTKLNKLREELHLQVIGRINEPFKAVECRSRRLYKSEKFSAWDVMLPIFSDCYHWGVLLLPENLDANKKHPVIVFQSNDLELPIDWNENSDNNAIELVKQGYITFLPSSIHRNGDNYFRVERKINAIGYSLGSMTIAANQQLLKWLKTMPQVDPQRIAFYEEGNQTFSMQIPALLTGYKSIISVDGFIDQTPSGLPVWNQTSKFQGPEIAALNFPRPLFIKEGPSENPTTAAQLAYRFARTKWWYDQFDRQEQIEIELLDEGQDQLPNFLDKNLRGR